MGNQRHDIHAIYPCATLPDMPQIVVARPMADIEEGMMEIRMGALPGRTKEFDIPVIVPFGRETWMVEATDGITHQQAVKMRSIQPPGEGWVIEHWSVYLQEPPIKIIVQMNPVSS